MFDVHEVVRAAPTVMGLPVYSIFVCLGIFLGVGYYMRAGHGANSRDGLLIAAAAIACGMLGSKIPVLLEGGGLLGKSIVGGLLGGMLGVVGVKRLFGIRMKMGNTIAPAAALGMAVGRLGCFFNGCCFGVRSAWGVDFGDGLRLPTQLFEALFHLLAFLLLHHYRERVKTPGILFKMYAIAYFIFRFFCEFIRENPRIWLQLSVYQVMCLAGVLYLAIAVYREKQVK